MTNRCWARFGFVSLAALTFWAASAAARGDALEDFNRLNAEFNTQYLAGKYREAQQTALAMRRIADGPLQFNPLALASALSQLGMAIEAQGRFSEAEPLYRHSLVIREQDRGPEHRDVAQCLSNIASLYKAQGRYSEMEPLVKRSMAILEKALGTEDPDFAVTVEDLAVLYRTQGRYVEAEPLFKRALAIREKALGSEHMVVAASFNNLAVLYDQQGRYAEAELLYRRALTICEKILSPEHPWIGVGFNNLALVYQAQGRHSEAEPIFKKALANAENALGPEHADVAVHLNNLAGLCVAEGRHAEAEPLYERALAIGEKALGPDSPGVAQSATGLATSWEKQGRSDRAAPLIDRTIAIYDRIGAAPGYRYSGYLSRARIAWKLNERDRAMADLRTAIQLAEQQRAKCSGSAHERAASFSGYNQAFEQMVVWQAELADLGAVLDALERSRARSLVDQMETQGIDLLAGVDESEAARLRGREVDAQSRIAGLEHQLQLLEQRKGLSGPQRSEQRARLGLELQKARTDYAETYADIRNASPAYRLAVARHLTPITLKELRQWTADRNAILLEYLLGAEGGYVLVVPASGAARLERLSVTVDQARWLGIEPGPLTAARMAHILVDEKGPRVLRRLRDPRDGQLGVDSRSPLAVLWEVLVPEAQRKDLLGGGRQQLMVIPDAALARLPFETLVTHPGEHPQYLLDVGPPIAYAPSATILVNLANRPRGTKNALVEPVLTVGEPNYGGPAGDAGAAPLAQLAPRSRFGGAGGSLTPLPFTGWETTWVGQIFGQSGIAAAQLRGDLATEAAVRHNATGRRILHLACHGLVDQAHGNLFGALALTPGTSALDPSDDGFLTLAEVYQLNLQGCELSVLSACDTNVGPQQQGEGVWALSRGFMVAGSRRVVASNWLVDDEAAATLVSYFCGGIARDEKSGAAVDYAAALHKAKKSVRQDPRWQNPYYWGSFVLVGPN